MNELSTALRGRLHSRMIQYDLFVFGKNKASVNVHISGESGRITLPFIIIVDGDKITCSHKSKDYELDSMNSAVSVIVKAVRVAEPVLSKIK